MAPHWPTFGELQEYLRGLGYSVGPGQPGYLVCEHLDAGSWFVFRDRDSSAPARETELLDLKVQLTHRGFVTDAEYARFWNPGVSRVETPSPTAPQ